MNKKLYDFIGKHKGAIISGLLICLCMTNVFAASDVADTTRMDKSVYNIVTFFNGGWVKGIACILLIGECLGLLFAGGQNPQIFKKFLPFIVGTVIFMCAGKIVNIIFATNSTNFNDDISGSGTSLLLQDMPTIPELPPMFIDEHYTEIT